MKLTILRTSVAVLMLLGASAVDHAQSISSQGPTGTSSINPRGSGDLRSGQIADPNLRHTGLLEQWHSLTPKPHLFPTAAKVVGKKKELYVALFNESYDKGSLIVSTLTFKLTKTENGKDRRDIKLQIAQVEENGKPTNILAADPPPFPLKDKGAQIPLSMEMKNGDYVVLRISILLDEVPVEFYLRLDSKGLSFAPAPLSPAREQNKKETMLESKRLK